MKSLFFSTLFLSLSAAYSQTEPLNQYDNAGKKDGKWVVYLDSLWNKVETGMAVYCRYTWYDHGVNIQPMGAGGSKKARMESSSKSISPRRTPCNLDGEYSWYEKGKLKYVHVLKNGEYVSYKEYSKKGILKTFFDYTPACDGQPHSWTLYVCDKNGSIIKSGQVCKDKDGKWPRMSD